MRLRILLSLYAVLMGIGGLVWLLLPARHLGLYGLAAPDSVAVLLGRYAGTMAVALGMMAWIARDAAASPARNALVLGIIVANGLGAIVCFLGALSAELNVFAWIPTAGYALLTVLFVVAGLGGVAEKPAAVAGS